jgi:hypothetical protein
VRKIKWLGKPQAGAARHAGAPANPLLSPKGTVMHLAAAASGNVSAGQMIVSLIVLLILIGMYFVPTIVAFFRHVPNVIQIAVLNFFLGWSVIGWIIALIWALRPATAAGFTRSA